MTYEDAIKVTEFVLTEKLDSGLNTTQYEECYNTLCLTKGSLEKQIPKKPEYETYPNQYEYWYCVNCGDAVLSKLKYSPIENEYPYKHCGNCGQAIDWNF